MTRRQNAPGHSAAQCWNEEIDDLDDPALICPIFGCQLTAENSVLMTWPDGHAEAVGRCRVHTDRRHRVLAGPGAVAVAS